MQFEKKQDVIFPRETNSFAAGGVASFDVTRELPIESMFLKATWSVSAYTAPTFTAEGPPAHVRRLVMSGADGARTRNAIDISGVGAIEYSKHITGYIDPITGSQVNSNRAAGTYAPTFAASTDYSIIYPIHFALPQLEDPLASVFLLPVDRYNANPQLQVQFAAAAEVFSAGTFTGQTARLSLLVNRRIINRLNWPVVDAELIEMKKDWTATGADQDWDIPITGYYTGLLQRDFRTSAIRGALDHATIGDYSDADNTNFSKLELSGNTLRRFRMADVEYENDLSEATGSGQGDQLAGSFFHDFLSDRVGGDSGDPGVALGSCLNANIPLNSGARLTLKKNVQTVTAGQTRTNLLFHRFFANIKDLQFA